MESTWNGYIPWIPYGFHVDSIWNMFHHINQVFTNGFHAHSMWNPSGIHVDSMLIPHGIILHGTHLTFL
jgi:hypothetical protein